MPSQRLKKWVLTNDFFTLQVLEDREGLFIPSPHIFPHIHIGRHFTVYAKSNHEQIKLIDTDTIYESRLSSVSSDSASESIIQICRYIKNQLA